jgi:hypothetical protein
MYGNGLCRKIGAMSEKIQSTEVLPMRGHSRGDWYCTLDDVAPSEADAEYWAVFGITHRGNRHCLGEFPTRQAAESAAHGSIALSGRVKRSDSGDTRRVVQIEVVAAVSDPSMVDVFALCDDGTIWRRGVGTRRASGLLDDRWEPLPLDGLDARQ